MQNTIAQVFGEVNAPIAIRRYGSGGIALFISNIVKLLIVGAGLFALFNIILAGYSFLSAGDDPKKMAAASAKIWQSLIGLAVAAGAIVLAMLFGQIIFGDPNALLQIQVFGPG